MNSIFGAFCVLLVYQTLLRGGLHVQRTGKPLTGTGPMPAFAAAIILACSFGWWTCATDGRVNSPALAAAIIAVGLAWGLLNAPSSTQYAALAGSIVLAVGMHQSNGLLIIPGVCVLLLIQGRLWSRIKLAAGFAAITLTGIAVLYVSIAFLIKGTRDIPGFTAWVFAYSRDGRWWDYNLASNTFADLRALGHVFLAGSTTNPLLFRTLAISAALTILAVPIYTLIRHNKLGEDITKKLTVLGAVLICYGTFFTLWNPGYFAFWLVQSFAVIAMLSLLISRWSRRMQAAALTGCLIWSAGALTLNTPTIIRRTQEASNPDLMLCKTLKTCANPGDLLVICSHNQTIPYAETYVPYFANVSVRSISAEIARSQNDKTRAIKAMRGIMRLRTQAGFRIFVIGNIAPGSPAAEVLRGYNLKKTFVVKDTVGYEVDMKKWSEAGLRTIR